MTVTEVIDTLQTWIRNADDEYDREEMGRVAGLKEALHEIKKIEPCGKDINVPATDAISRQAVLNILDDMVKNYIKENDFDKAQGVAWVKVQKLPPVTPQPKTGYWEWVQYDYNPKLGNWHCSECRCVVVECVDKNEKGGIPLYKYCPQCGAKMLEPQGSEVEE